MVYLSQGLLLSQRQALVNATTWCLKTAQRKKPDTERHILYNPVKRKCPEQANP